MKLFKDNVFIDDINDIASNLSRVMKSGDIVIFKGDIGAGKTTLIKSLVKHLGCEDEVTSPTFSIVNTYGDFVVHIDTYRLESVNELYDLGFETLFDEKFITFIEWGERIQDYIDKEHFVIEIIEKDRDQRTIYFETSGDREKDIVAELKNDGWLDV
ncbi:MAG: tRNA (adenosine(37)-N6)-threonylcarbamoyltransferase complex ATPase subunit type 1 TsaE [Acidimicrobiia bacterium]